MIENDFNENIIHYACLRKRQNVIEFATRKKSALTSDRNTYGDCPFHYAMMNKFEQADSILLDRTNDLYENALQFIVMTSNQNNFGNFHNRLSENSNNQNTPLFCYAVLQGNQYLMNQLSKSKALQKNKQKENAIDFALRSKNQSCLVELVKLGVKLDETDSDGNTVLHRQCEDQNLFNIQKLLMSKVDVNIVNRNGLTPLAIALKNKSMDIVSILIQFGARLDIQDSNGDTSVHILCKSKDWEVLQKIPLQNVINIQNKKGETPVIVSLKNKNLELSRLLIQQGSNLNIADSEGNYPIILVLENNMMDLLNMILQGNVNINVKNSKGVTPL